MEFNKLHLLGYANGNFGKHILFGTLDLVLLFYLTDSLGLDPFLSGLIIFIAMLVDASLDPVIGFVIDKFKWRYGHYIFIGAIFYSLSFVLIFTIGLLQWHSITVYCAVLVLFRLSYTLIDVPHNALIAKLFVNGNLRTKVSAYRFLFSSLSALLIALAIAPILMGDGREQELIRFFYFAVIAASLSFISLNIVSYVALKYERLSPSVKQHGIGFYSLVKQLLSNQQLVIALIVCFFTGLCSPILSKGILYFAKYYLLNEAMAGYMLPAMMLGQIIALPLWVKIAKYRGKKVALQLSHSLLFLGALLLLMIEPSAQYLVVVLAFIAGVAYSAIYMVIWSMLADVVDYQEINTSIRADAVMFALGIMVMKIASGLGNVVFGLLLDIIGYQADKQLTVSSASQLASVVCLMPAFGAVICVWALNNYSITTKLQARWQKVLATRRSV